ncbi:MAG: hypothetical protein WCS77_04345 [Elusimicrobiaceae bacterium]|jgi:hypothetical protein
MHEHENCCSNHEKHEDREAIRRQVTEEIMAELDMESDPAGSWREAFEDAYYELQVEAIKEVLAKKHGKFIKKGADIMADYLISEIHDEACRAEAEDEMLEKMETLAEEQDEK